MKNKEKKILLALGDINEKYLEQARPRERKNHTARILTVAASFVVVVGIALGVILLGGNTPPTGDVPPIVDIPFPEVPRTDKSLAAVMQDYLNSNIGSDDIWEDDGIFDESENSPDMILPEGGSDSGSNGSYVEVTDNQVQGIIEGDLYKTTDKYIFRYGNKRLYIYSIDGENSREISSLYISSGGSTYYTDMFLSEDGNTVTLVQEEYIFSEEDNPYRKSDATFVYSVDVSDVNNPVMAKAICVAGLKKAVRKIDGQIYLVTTPGFDKRYIEPDNPETYIPGIVDDENNIHLCDVNNIYYPEEISRASYVYVNLLDEKDLSVVSEYAILEDHNTWVSGVYFTQNHIVAEYQSGKRISEEEATSEAYSWIELIDFSGEKLRYRGSLEIAGWAETGQYSYDERDGYLRVVASTRIWKRFWVEKSSVSLYVYDLSTMTLSASVDNFAPEGERATAVRFEGDKLYVCTAETSRFTDPVFFFDLSDYDNITQVNTGYIEGFSSSLIDLGDGYLLGIGRESREQGKIEIYKRDGDKVVSVAEFLFYGTPSSAYKSYLIDRERNLFGFASNSYRENQNDAMKSVYLILQLDKGELRVVEKMEISTGGRAARAFYRDGYVYFTGNAEFKVTKLDIK